MNLPLANIHPSPWNPRGAIDDAALADLVASITTHGVLTPLLVRPVFVGDAIDHYEIIAGHRRARGASLAGLTEVPVTVEPMADNQARAIAIVENLQREDVHPLDEAKGYAQLQLTDDLSIEDIAARVGKSRTYIAQRLTLTSLVELAVAAFRAGHLQLGHAQVLASLTPADQVKALEYAFGAGYTPDMPERLHLRRHVTVAALAQWVTDQVLQDLSRAIWPLEEIGLGEAPACTACEKRGGLQEGLFDEDEAEPNAAGWCRDGACFARKAADWLNLRAQQEARRTGLEVVRVVVAPYHGAKVPKGVLVCGKQCARLSDRAPACPDTKLGLVAMEGASYQTGPQAKVGETFRICVAETCKKHGRRKPDPKPKAGPRDAAASEQTRKAAAEQRVAAAKARETRLAVLVAQVSWPLPAAVIDLLLAPQEILGAAVAESQIEIPASLPRDTRLVRALVIAAVGQETESWRSEDSVTTLPALERAFAAAGTAQKPTPPAKSAGPATPPTTAKAKAKKAVAPAKPAAKKPASVKPPTAKKAAGRGKRPRR